MRKDITVAAEPRAARGKNEARRLRVSGKVPAVVYGAYKDTVPVAVSPRELTNILHSKTGHNTIFNIDIQGVENTPVMIVDSQFDPIKDRLLHADLKRIDLQKRLRVTVPVHPKGEAKGVKQQGGLFEIVTREIEIECLPDDIPEHFEIDVTELLIGQNLRAANVALSGSMKLLSPSEQVLVHVVMMRQEVVATPEVAPAEATAAEPEVIKKGKKEEEAAAAEDEKKKKK